MNKKDKKILRACDWIMIAALVFMIGARVTTVYLTSDVSKITGSDITEIVKVMETNPLVSWLVNVNKLFTMFFLIILPAFVLSLYWAMRKRVNMIILQFYSSLFMIVTGLDFLNNLSHVLVNLIKT